MEVCFVAEPWTLLSFLDLFFVAGFSLALQTGINTTSILEVPTMADHSSMVV